MAINSVSISGNLCADAELRTTKSGFEIVECRVAVNTRRKGQSGEWEDYPNFITVKVLGNRGSRIVGYLTKGTKVTVQGKLSEERWEQDGQKRSKLVVVADEVEFMSRGESSGRASARDVVKEAFPQAQVSAYSEQEIPF